jgi:hypothetical protein
MRLYLHDLKPEAQRRVLRFLGLKSPEGGNLDVFPIASISKLEPEGNIEVICSKCAEERYGRKKGSFTKKTLRDAEFVKALFGREHMWVKVKEVKGDCVVGTVDNIPVLEDSPRYGEEVKVSFYEVEDVLFRRGREDAKGKAKRKAER